MTDIDLLSSTTAHQQWSPLDQWLKDMLDAAASSPDHIWHEVMLVTPEIAAYLLGRNPQNRSIKPTRVRLYAGMMQRGEWKLNGQPIIIADTGELNDGQNRLQAVIESGIAVHMLLIFGVTRDSRTSLDMGLNRSIGDILTMVGFDGGGDLGTFARYLIEFDKHREIDLAQALQPSRQQIIEYVGSRPDLVDEITAFSRGQCKRVRATRAVIVFAYHVIINETPRIDIADTFFDRLIGGHDLSQNHPILTARNRLLRDREAEFMSANLKVEIIFRSWNAFRRNVTASKFMTKGEGPLPKLEA